MSTITFPGQLHVETHRPQSPSASSTGEGTSQSFYASFIDAGAGSGFQMNPLSQHPPRTPRTSIATSSHSRTQSMSQRQYGSSMYDSHDETHAEETEEERTDGGFSLNDGSVAGAVDVEDDETGKLKLAESKVRSEDVWREMVKSSVGRDKSFKLLQYGIRIYLVFHLKFTASRLFKNRTRPPWEAAFVKRLQSTQSGFSFSRKTLLLFNWLAPLTAITAEERAVPFSTEKQTSPSSSQTSSTAQSFLQTLIQAPPPILLQLVQAIADDLYTFSLLGLLGKRFGERAAKFSDRCWLLATLVGLVENGVERGVVGGLQREVEGRLYHDSMSGATAKSRGVSSKIDERELGRLQRQDFWLQITRAKLFMDLIFVSYDIFKIQRWRETVKAITGLSSAFLSSAKLFDKHKADLMKKIASSL